MTVVNLLLTGGEAQEFFLGSLGFMIASFGLSCWADAEIANLTTFIP